ncbi:MAG: hypothetical protein OEW08_03950 [Gammaproteobacteria bacterium]|nr:hypothetical protein [Gammaproteobacteria bacterium]
MKLRAWWLLGVIGSAIFSTQALAWNNSDSAFESAYLLTHVADWGQTRDIAARCNGGRYYETNLIMGTCPSIATVNTYFISTAILHISASYLLPTPYRRIFQAGTIGMQIGYINNNANIGLNLRF